MTNFGFFGYASAAILFFVFSLLLLTSWRGRLQGGLMVIASLVTTAWAALLAVQAAYHIIPVNLVWAIEALRYLAWTGFLLRLLGSQFEQQARQRKFLRLITWAILALCLLLAIPFEELRVVSSLLGWVNLDLDFRILGQVFLAIAGMAMVEQLFRNTPLDQRWGIKFLCLGLGGMFAFDFYLFSDALLFKQLDAGIWHARGAVNALIVPLVGVAAARNPHWSLPLFISRSVVFHTTTLFSAGIYMLFMALAGYYIRLYGGEWGTALQTLFFFSAGLMLLLLLFSGQLRARFKVFLNKHFFSYKYDYREEWLRLISTFSGKGKGREQPLTERVIHSLCDLVDSTGGVLWLVKPDGKVELGANWMCTADIPEGTLDFGTLLPYLEHSEWIVNLEEYAENPDIYDGLYLSRWLAEAKELWLIVPLFHEDSLLGLVILRRPRVAQNINWENMDLLKTIGRQAASYLALEQAAQALAEARQFEGFNRLAAFVMHDLKNVIAQLSLVAKNAQRHRNNPAFIDDAIATIENAVGKMSRLMGQLRSATPGGQAGLADVRPILQEIVRERSVQNPVPTLEVNSDVPMMVRAERDRLAAVVGHIVQNAQEATPPHGQVRVQLRTGADQVIVDIRDSGAGMDPAFVKERLFKPFDSTKGLAGMGIGAYECREFVQSVGGRVEVESEPGKGTLFSILLPRAEELVSEEPFAELG